MNLPPSNLYPLCIRFEAFCKKVLTFQNYKLLSSEKRWRTLGFVFSDLEEGILDQYYTIDDYEVMHNGISIDEFTFFIENELLYQALVILSPKRMEIIVLSFFLDMTDKEIGKKMLLPQSTVRYNRVVAIKMLKRIMEELHES